MQDRNKTELTHKVTDAVDGWLDERGFKPVETEVYVCEGWIADLAGVIVPTQTELQELRLLPRKPKWEKREEVEAWYALANERQQLMTALVEVKTSRADFRGDKKWGQQPPTNLAYLAIPNDLPMSPTELPEGWGLLAYSAATQSIRQTRPPIIREATADQKLCVVHEIGVRRDHRTRYENHREAQKADRIHQNQEVSRTRIRDAISAVTAVFHGCRYPGKPWATYYNSVQEILESFSIKHLQPGDIEALEQLWKKGAVEQPLRSVVAG